ncbi:GAF domain-containing sensor histidine kinase [bacterium]|nr:GAF domain-containing sensor histidine kinase [bacterium]
MASLKIHIDLVDKIHLELVIKAAGHLGWEVSPGTPGAKPPDVLVTTPERLHRHRYLKERIDLHPQILLMASSQDTDPNDLLGVRVMGFLDPEMRPGLINEILLEAGNQHLKYRDGFSMWHQMEERYAESSVLLDLALELGPELSIEEVLGKIVQHLADDLGYAIVSIMFLDEKEGHLTIRAAKGLSQRIIETTRMEIGKGVSGSVAQSGEPLLLKDVEAEERFAKVRSHGRYTTKSLICVPLKVGDRVIGVLNANNKSRSNPLNEFDLRILSVFATHISVSIERIRLYHNLERKAQELEEAYGKLKIVDQVKSDFIINVSHEYRTPVTIILGYLELLKSTLNEPSHMEKVSVAMEAANRLSSLIDDSTDLLRLDTGSSPFHFQEAQLHYFLEESVRGQWPRFGSKGVDLSLDLPDSLPPIWADQAKMIKAFDKLLDNALKFTPKGGYTRIKAQSYGEGGVLVSVEDSGSGVPHEDLTRIFDRFEQGGDIMTEKPEGTGLGLPIAKAIVAGHRGTIRIDKEYVDGCRIIVTLPCLDSWGKGVTESPESRVQSVER